MEELVRQLVETLELLRRLGNEHDQRKDEAWERGQERRTRIEKKLAGEAVPERPKEAFADRIGTRLEKVKLARQASAETQRAGALLFRLLRDLSHIPEARAAADHVWDLMEEMMLLNVGVVGHDEEEPPMPTAEDFPTDDPALRMRKLLEYSATLREFGETRKAAEEAQRTRRNELLSQAVMELRTLLG